MIIIKMQDYIVPIKRPLNLWNKYSIRPGVLGSVGDAMLQVRLKQSAPDMNPRYESWTAKEAEKYLGSNVQDGQSKSFSSHGGGAITKMGRMRYRNSFRTQQGWIHQDIKEVDRASEPITQDQPQYSWKSQVASVERAKTTGQMFLPLPGGYEASRQTRGNNAPRIVEQSSGTGTVLPATLPEMKYAGETPGVVERMIEGGGTRTTVGQPYSFQPVRAIPNKSRMRS